MRKLGGFDLIAFCVYLQPPALLEGADGVLGGRVEVEQLGPDAVGEDGGDEDDVAVVDLVPEHGLEGQLGAEVQGDDVDVHHLPPLGGVAWEIFHWFLEGLIRADWFCGTGLIVRQSHSEASAGF